MPAALNIPVGPENIKSLFPSIQFADVSDYQIEILDGAGNILATSPEMILTSACDGVRVHFANRSGMIDAIDLAIDRVVHAAKGAGFQRPLTGASAEHSDSKFNVRANDTFILKSARFSENDQDWLDELVDSPLVWMEVYDFRGEPSVLIPVVVLDSEREKIKQDERYVYELSISVRLSHERNQIRN
jgi:hypothetical protein